MKYSQAAQDILLEAKLARVNDDVDAQVYYLRQFMRMEEVVKAVRAMEEEYSKSGILKATDLLRTDTIEAMFELRLLFKWYHPEEISDIVPGWFTPSIPIERGD